MCIGIKEYFTMSTVLYTSWISGADLSLELHRVAKLHYIYSFVFNDQVGNGCQYRNYYVGLLSIRQNNNQTKTGKL